MWTTPQALQDEGILISQHMMTDHFPDVVSLVLEHLVSSAAAAPAA